MGEEGKRVSRSHSRVACQWPPSVTRLRRGKVSTERGDGLSERQMTNLCLRRIGA